MRITVQSKLSRGETHEGSAFSLTAKFYDDASDPWTLSAPTTIRYRIDDISSGITVADWTSVSPASSVSITVTGAQNAMQNAGRSTELREMTIQANAGLSSQYSSTYSWLVNNIQGVV